MTRLPLATVPKSLYFLYDPIMKSVVRYTQMIYKHPTLFSCERLPPTCPKGLGAFPQHRNARAIADDQLKETTSCIIRWRRPTHAEPRTIRIGLSRSLQAVFFLFCSDFRIVRTRFSTCSVHRLFPTTAVHIRPSERY